MATCKTCNQSFEITAAEKDFLSRMAWKFGGQTVFPAAPVKCPQCRLQSRVAYRNEKNLYRNTSAKSGKDVISIYAKEPLWGESYAVYTQEEWQADDFDPLEWGRDFDFSRPFFDQFAELLKAVPRMAIVTLANENCDYTSGTAYSKNCYLINSSEYCEDCYYGKLYQKCSDCMDCAYMFDSELCYECCSLHDCSRCTYVYFSQNCHDCLFSSDLNGCKNCCLCTNLHQKQYCFANKQLTKEEYEERVKNLTSSHEGIRQLAKQFEELRTGQKKRAAHIVNSENCSGDFIEGSRNCIDCYDMTESEDCMYITVGVNTKDCIDCCNMYINPELVYDTLGTIEAYNSAYSSYIFHSQNMLYCDMCYYCSDCFGCSGLTRKKHCIFNKQYTETEYNELVPKIIGQMQANGEWGLFFPAQYSPFGYNESLASEYLPLTKEQADEKGFLWRELHDEALDVQKTIAANQLPDSIDDVPDDILNWAIVCSESGRPYKIVKRELDFYRARGLPIPRLHPDVRYRNRMKLRNARQLRECNCSECSALVTTTYAEDQLQNILCHECYRKELY